MILPHVKPQILIIIIIINRYEQDLQVLTFSNAKKKERGKKDKITKGTSQRVPQQLINFLPKGNVRLPLNIPRPQSIRS